MILCNLFNVGPFVFWSLLVMYLFFIFSLICISVSLMFSSFCHIELPPWFFWSGACISYFVCTARQEFPIFFMFLVMKFVLLII